MHRPAIHTLGFVANFNFSTLEPCATTTLSASHVSPLCLRAIASPGGAPHHLAAIIDDAGMILPPPRHHRLPNRLSTSTPPRAGPLKASLC